MQSCIVLEGRRLPDLDPRQATCHYPGTKYEYLPYRLVEVTRKLELCDLLAPLEHPEALRASIARVSPSGEHFLFP